MARQDVDIGVEGNDGTGDSIRESFRKVNENFTELYAVFGVEGNLTFTSLADTPNILEGGKIVQVDPAGNSVIFSSITSSDGTINVNVETTGEIDLKVASVQIVADTGSPTLGNHLSAANFGIGGVAISDAAAAELSSQPGRSQTFTIDDLVITKGYADRRYVTSGLPIRVAAEPSTNTQYTLTIDSYSSGGNLVFLNGHGYDSGANGTAFIFQADDTDPTGLTSGTTYFIKYESSTELALYPDKENAASETPEVGSKILVSGNIAATDTHTIVDAGFDRELTGNFLSDVAMPRESVTRRQGDSMEGALFLHDHPGDLSGQGTPNGQEDLQAATKYYVDNTAYSSPEVLFVSTGGDDKMTGVPAGKEGTSNTYAYRTINAAALRATELISTAPEEPGPYFQTLSYGATPTSAGTASTVINASVETPNNIDTRQIILNNKDFLIKEITGYLAFTYPDFAYNVETCERDLGLVLDAVSFDALRGDTANYLSRTAAERYYSSVSGRIAITSQLERTDDAFAKTLEILQAVLQNSIFLPKIVTSIGRKVGDTPARVTTSVSHGLKDGNQVIFKDISGMTAIEDEILFVKVVDANTFEIFTDETLETPFDNSDTGTYLNFVNDGSGKIGLRYQQKLSQNTTVSPISPSDSGYLAVTQNFALIRNIIRNGIDVGADIAFGNRYQLDITNNTAGFIDQTNPENIDALPGKVIVGKRSGAIGRIITFTQNTSETSFFLQPLEARDFEAGEELEMGNFVKAKQVVIRVEAGIYEEDYPIKLTKNVSLKGDEFRRVIIRPKRRVSQSSIANTYFYRDKEFDGITLLSSGTPFINQVGEIQGYFGYHYLTDNTRPVNTGLAVNNIGGYTTAAKILELNRTFIQKEVGEYVDTTYPTLFSTESRAKCERDVGLIVDGIINDLKRGGKEGVLENQGEYYSGALTPGTETETEDAIDQIATIAGQLLIGSDPSSLGFNRSTIEVDLTEGAAEAEWSADRTYNQNDFVKLTVGLQTFFYKCLKTHISSASDINDEPLDPNFQKLDDITLWKEVPGSVALVGELKDIVTFAFDPQYNPPKRNDADGVDVFLMDDATIVRNVTVQGHGGFMCVLDPTGQILTKSPYIQTASSFSRSRNAKAFSGGMFVDAFAGNIPIRVTANSGTYTDSAGSVSLDAFTISVESLDVGGEPQGLKLRLPELPAPFYFEGQRYQVNAISNYDSGTGRAVLYLDPTSNNGNGWNLTGGDSPGDPGHNILDTIQDIFLQTAGNRSILGNDYTQINDLGYGLVTTNGAFSEMVSMFTYYCHAAYYANNGSEIRSLNGSNGYGNFGLVAEGADPNEIPDEVTLLRSSVQPVKAFTYSGFTNAFDDTAITLYDFKEEPLSNSFIYIDHGGATGALNYRINRVENLSDPANDGNIGSQGAVVATGIETVNNSSITGSSPGGNGSFNNVPQKSTTGSGYDAKFNVTITAGVPSFVVANVGQNYSVGDTITISGADIGGANNTNDLTIPVSAVYGTTSGTDIGPNQTGNITGATTAQPVVITDASHGLSNGDRIYIDSVGGMEELNDNYYWVGNVTANTFELYTNASTTIELDGRAFSNYTSGGTWLKRNGIGNNVYRLTLQEAGSNNDFFPGLQAAVSNNTFVDYRHGENFIFSGVANPDGITERPSTAINFDESDNITYRSTGFTQTDDTNNRLGEDEIKSTTDASFKTIPLIVDSTAISTTDPNNGAKTLGAQVSDTKIAIERLDTVADEERLVKDSTDALAQSIKFPGDAGYTGGMVFAYQGKLFQIIDYQPLTAGSITNITQANPAVVTSAGHGLSNGSRIEIRQVEGMTEVNGGIFYVGNVTTNTFRLYTDVGLSNTLDASNYTAYTSGGQWFDPDSVFYIEIQDYQDDGADWDITGSAANLGIKTAFTGERTIHAGVQGGTTAEITISISLLRATGHDFTKIGTGGFNDSNYPNVLLGQAVGGSQAKAGAYSDADNATKSQVWERRKGRVFFITSDEDGFFRVGKYFVVDQSTGSITFAGEVGISRAASLGFKDGVTINEFSNDELFTDLSDTAVPTEKAIANYVSRRLGHNGSVQLTGSARFNPGFLALDGSTPLEANLNMNSKQIKNLLDPVDDNDGATKDYVVQATRGYDEFDDLRNITIHDRVGSGDEQKQVLVPTGYKRLVTEPLNGVITAGDLLQDGSSTANVIAVENRFDYVLNKNISIITYDLQTGGGFNTTLSPVYVTSVGTKSANVLENPIDEFTNAREDSASDINITVTRTTPDTTINLQIEPQAILNSDINDDAEVSQSKLMMNRAKPLTNSAGLYGTDQDGGSNGEGDADGSGRTGQSSRGLAAFEYESFAEDIQLTLTGSVISANAGDILYQGDPGGGTRPTGYVVNSISNSATVIIRTSDTWAIPGATIFKSEITNGVPGTAVTTGATVFTNGYLRSGFINIKDRGVDYTKLPNLTGGNTGDAYGGSVIGRATDGNGLSEEVSFATVVDQGRGLADGDFTTEHPYWSNPPTNTVANDPGEALIQTGTSGNGDYAYTSIAYDNAGNSIAKRTISGALHADSYIIGGSATNTILSETSGTLNFTTPGGGTILTSSGASKPLIETGGNIVIGDMNSTAADESSFHAASTYGSSGGAGTTEETSALASRWIYTTFIEAATEKGASSTGIGLGTGTGFTDANFGGGADIITLITNGNVVARATSTNFETNNISSGTNNQNLTLAGKGTGIVSVSDNLSVSGSITCTSTITLNGAPTNAFIYEGTADAFETRIRFGDPTEDNIITVPDNSGTVVVAGGSSASQSGLDLSISSAGVMSGSAEGLATTDSPTFAGATLGNIRVGVTGDNEIDTSSGNLTIDSTGGTTTIDDILSVSGNATFSGTVSLTGTSALTTRNITTGAAATTGSVTGNWSLTTGSRFQATYADIAEYYEADTEYEVGTVLVFGGDKEVTISNSHRSTRIAGVVSENAAFIMNDSCPGIATVVALTGRVPMKVIGQVSKGDMIVSSAIPGYGIVDNDPKVGTVIGKAVGAKDDDGKGIVEVVVGRV